jgi:hypothetical protein
MRLISVLFTSTLLSACALLPPTTGEQNPNIVSTDAFRNEVWIYDKFSTETVRTEGPSTMAFLQHLANVEGLAGSSRRKTESSSQRTLTVIIKFDEYGAVRDYAYHVSRF